LSEEVPHVRFYYPAPSPQTQPAEKGRPRLPTHAPRERGLAAEDPGQDLLLRQMGPPHQWQVGACPGRRVGGSARPVQVPSGRPARRTHSQGVRLQPLLDDDRTRGCIQVVEDFADERATGDELQAAEREATEVWLTAAGNDTLFACLRLCANEVDG